MWGWRALTGQLRLFRYPASTSSFLGQDHFDLLLESDLALTVGSHNGTVSQMFPEFLVTREAQGPTWVNEAQELNLKGKDLE